MKKSKKILSLLLVFSLILTMFSLNAMVSSAEAANTSLIEKIEVDLTKSTYLKKELNVTPLQDGVISTTFYQSWYPENTKVDGLSYFDDAISLKNKDGDYITIASGYRYVINVKYTVTYFDKDSNGDPTSAPQVSIIYNNADNKTGLNGDNTLVASSVHKATGTYTLSAITDGIANRPLRIGFGGKGKVAIEYVEIQRVPLGTNAKIVTYVDGGLETKEFAIDTLKTPIFRGAKEAVFDNWYEDATFTRVATAPSENGKYYARWLSVTRELDLKNLNRMNSWNDGGTDDNNLKLIPATDSSSMQVVVNQTTKPSNFWGGSDVNLGGSQDISLEYFDYDVAVQDNAYSGYVYFEKDKSYAINVDYSVIENTGGVSLYLTSNGTNISYGNSDNNKSRYIGAKSINSSTIESGVFYVEFSSSSNYKLMSAGYGSTKVDDKLRLSVYGKGTVIINAITIQEIYTADQDTGVAVPVLVMSGANKCKAAAIKKNNEWILPEPYVKANVTEKVLSGWYTDAALSVPFTSPATNTAYYPAWLPLTTELDIANSGRMIDTGISNNSTYVFTNSTDLSVSSNTANAPLEVVVNSTNELTSSKQHLALKYRDLEKEAINLKENEYSSYVSIASGKLYLVTAKFSVKDIGSTAPEIGFITSGSSISGNSVRINPYSTTIKTAGEYEFSRIIYVGNRNCAANDKLRLAFRGQGTFEIASVTVSEIAQSDVVAGKVANIYYVENGTEYGYFSIKDGDNWPMPEVAQPQGNITQSLPMVWCSDSSLSNVMDTPVAGTTYYPKWPLTVRDLDLKNPNRMSGFNSGGDSDSTLKLIPATDSSPMKVVVNGDSYYLSDKYGADSANPNYFPEYKQHITLEYFDNDSNVQDLVYDGYVQIKSGKQYSYKINYNVTSLGGSYNKVQMYLVSNAKRLSWLANTPIMGNKNIDTLGVGVMSGVFYAGYGGAKADDYVRLGFAGTGTIEIESITIQEVVASDVNAGKAVDINTNVDGYTHRTYTVKNGNTWIMPEYAPLKGNVVDYNTSKWYSDSSYTTIMTEPTTKATYYQRFLTTTRKLDIANSSRMINQDEDKDNFTYVYTNTSDFSIYSDVDNVPLKVVVNNSNDLTNTKQQLSLKYYDAENESAGSKENNTSGYVTIATGKFYAVNVKYAVKNIESKAEIGLVTSSSYILSGSATKNSSVTLNANGNYEFSQIVYVGSNGCANNNKLRIAFSGNATFEIESITITENYTQDNVKPVVYVDSHNSYYQFMSLGDDLLVPEGKTGFVFEGWYDSKSNLINSASQITSTTAATTLTAKWLKDGDLVDIDLSISESLRNVDKNGKTTMTLTPYADQKDINVQLNSDWNNIFVNADGSANTTGTLYPDAVLSLKVGTGTDVADYVKFDGDYQYIVNIEYEVTKVSDANPIQVAIVKNAQNAIKANNGSIVFSTATHTSTGKYKLSAIISGEDYVPLRLAFGGVGNVIVTSAKLQLEIAYKDFAVVNMQDEVGTYVQLMKPGALLPVYEQTSLKNFSGWYAGNEKVTTVSGDMDVTEKWFDRFDVTMDDEFNVCDLFNVRSNIEGNSKIYDVNRDATIDSGDVHSARRSLLSNFTIGDIDISSYTVVQGGNTSLLSDLAVDSFIETVKSIYGIELTKSDDLNAENKIVIGVTGIDDNVINYGAIDQLVGAKDDVYGVDDYKIFVFESDLYIEAGSDYATAVATNELTDFMNEYKGFPASYEIAAMANASSELLDGYTRMWGDEFNSASFNTNIWYFSDEEALGTNYDLSDPYYKASIASRRNGDSSDDFGGPWDYDDTPGAREGTIKYGENYTLGNGVLTLNTKKTDTGYSAAKINAKQHFTYGIMTARVKLAVNNGATSAVWARTHDQYGHPINEMDFVENYGAKQILANLHTWNTDTEEGHIIHENDIQYLRGITTPENDPTYFDRFHDIAMIWTEEKIEFYIDGQLYLRQDITDLNTWEAFHKSVYMIFDASVPSNYYADTHNGMTPGEILMENINSFNENMQIDYVRWYQKQ